MTRRHTLTVSICTLALAIAGVAAVFAAPLREYEIEYDDGNGAVVGIRGHDCVAGNYRWGVITPNKVVYDFGPCM